MSLVQPAEQTPGRTNQDKQQEILAFNYHVIDIALFYTRILLMATHRGGRRQRKRGICCWWMNNKCWFCLLNLKPESLHNPGKASISIFAELSSWKRPHHLLFLPNKDTVASLPSINSPSSPSSSLYLFSAPSPSITGETHLESVWFPDRGKRKCWLKLLIYSLYFPFPCEMLLQLLPLLLWVSDGPW